MWSNGMIEWRLWSAARISSRFPCIDDGFSFLFTLGEAGQYYVRGLLFVQFDVWDLQPQYSVSNAPKTSLTHWQSQGTARLGAS